MKNKIMLNLLFLVSWVFINTGFAAGISSHKTVYGEDESVLIKLVDKPGKEKDWIAIYPAGAYSNWTNVVSWVWARDLSVVEDVPEGDWYKFKDEDSDLYNQPEGYGKYSVALPIGDYEARLFLNNSYDTEASVAFSVREASALEIISSDVEKRDENSVYVEFDLNQKAQGQIEYGTTTEYGSFTTKETSFDYDSHRQLVSNLDPDALYHYRVHAFDENGVQQISEDKTFLINSSLEIISSAVERNDDTSVHIEFNLNQKAQGQIEYGTTADFGNFTTKETSFDYASHRQLVSDLAPNTLYHYRVHAWDEGGFNVVSESKTFRTNASLEIELSRVEVIDDTSVYIHFDLNQQAQGQVEYGTSLDYGNFTTKETSFDYSSHRQRITNLDPNTLYHYRVHAFDEEGVEVISEDRTFRTKALVYPADTQLNRIGTQNVPKPPYLLATYDEPSFATRVTRLSDRAVNNDNRHPITKNGGAWNSDMTVLKMHFALYDARTLQKINLPNPYYKLGAPNSSDIRWSKVDAHTLYTLDDKKRLRKIVLNNDYTDSNHDDPESVLRDFSGDYEAVSFGSGEGNLSNADQVVITAKKSNSNTIYAILYDLQKNEEVWTYPVPDSHWIESDWVSISPKGNYVVFNTRKKVYRFDNEFQNRQLIDDEAEHGDLGINQNGNEVYVQFGFAKTDKARGIWSINLDTGEKVSLLGASAYGGGHVSCQNHQRPGWCYVSTGEEGYREVFAVKLDKTKTVQRFAQTHASRQNFSSHVNVSPDGTEVLFESDWGIQGGVSDTYLVKMP